MHPLIDGACLGKAMLAVFCASGVAILAGIALVLVFHRSPDRRLAGRDRMVTSRGLPPVEAGRDPSV